MVAEEAKAEIEAARDDDDDNNDLLPDGFVTVGVDDYMAPWTYDKACAALNYMLTSNTRGLVAGRAGMRGGPGAGILLVWSLEKIARMYPKDDLVLLSESELTEALDAVATEGLLKMFGCVRKGGDSVEDAPPSWQGSQSKGQPQGPHIVKTSVAAPIAPPSESSATAKTSALPEGKLALKPASSEGRQADVAPKVALGGSPGVVTPSEIKPSSWRLSSSQKSPVSA